MAEKQRAFKVVMTESELDAVDTVVKLRGFKSRLSYIKGLIERDAAEAGVNLEFSGTWGGWRGGRKADREKA